MKDNSSPTQDKTVTSGLHIFRNLLDACDARKMDFDTLCGELEVDEDFWREFANNTSVHNHISIVIQACDKLSVPYEYVFKGKQDVVSDEIVQMAKRFAALDSDGRFIVGSSIILEERRIEGEKVKSN